MLYYHSILSKKTLKILNDANVPNYLQNKIIDWAVKAKQSNIDFGDMKKTRKRTLNQIKN